MKWINDKLNRNYDSATKLKNGKGLGKIIGNVLGYSVSSKALWKDIEDLLNTEHIEKDISVGKLQCGNTEEIVKFVSWLKYAEEN